MMTLLPDRFDYRGRRRQEQRQCREWPVIGTLPASASHTETGPVTHDVSTFHQQPEQAGTTYETTFRLADGSRRRLAVQSAGP